MLTASDQSLAPLDHIALGVVGFRNVLVNVYAVSAGDGTWVLIDAGLPFSASHIREWAESHFGAGAWPTAILLTHGHFDHVGSLQDLAEGWDVPVYAHRLEKPYVTGESPYPPPDPTVGGGAMAWLSPLYPRGPINLGQRLRLLPEDGSVPGLPGWRWLATPGHSPGHVSFFREEDRTLIAGDAFVTTKQESVVAVINQTPEFHGPPMYYTCDWDAARSSVEKLAALEPAVVACGHGRPIGGHTAAATLQQLATQFDFWARPAQGRYREQPAMTDEHGIVSVPPSNISPATKYAFGLAAAAALFFAVRSMQRRDSYSR